MKSGVVSLVDSFYFKAMSLQADCTLNSTAMCNKAFALSYGRSAIRFDVMVKIDTVTTQQITQTPSEGPFPGIAIQKLSNKV